MAHLQAEYADGYLHDELALNDVSPYAEGRNVFYDILERKPEPEHGPLKRLTLFTDGERFDIDWTRVPEGARPIRFRKMELDLVQTGEPQEARCVGVVFGYQYNDADGKNHQVVEEF